MQSPAGTTVVAQGDMAFLRDVKAYLQERGVESQLVSPPGGCGTG
jgi:hypothetical protein